MADAPTQIIAGDSASWTVTLSAYPASGGYAFAYSGLLIGAPAGTAPIAISTSGSGSVFTVNLHSSDTAAWAPGVYVLTGYATKDSDRYTVCTTQLTVAPNPAANSGSTHASRTLALIEAAMENRIPRGLQNTIIDGQQLDRIPFSTLYDLRSKYRAEVILEQRAAAAKAGIRPRTSIGIRFVRP